MITHHHPGEAWYFTCTKILHPPGLCGMWIGNTSCLAKVRKASTRANGILDPFLPFKKKLLTQSKKNIKAVSIGFCGFWQSVFWTQPIPLVCRGPLSIPRRIPVVAWHGPARCGSEQPICRLLPQYHWFRWRIRFSSYSTSWNFRCNIWHPYSAKSSLASTVSQPGKSEANHNHGVALQNRSDSIFHKIKTGRVWNEWLKRLWFKMWHTKKLWTWHPATKEVPDWQHFLSGRYCGGLDTCWKSIRQTGNPSPKKGWTH